MFKGQMPGPKAAKAPKGATGGTKTTGGSQPRSGSSITSEKNMKKDGKTSAEKRVVTLEMENMMLRKKLNIAEIKKEFQKSGVQESDMNSLFFDCLHDLELKIQQYESKAGEHVSGNFTDLEKDLQNERAKIKSLEKDLMEKTTHINEKDKELRAAKTEILVQKDFTRHSRDTIDRLEKLQAEYDTLKLQIRDSNIRVDKQTANLEELETSLDQNKTTLRETEANLQATKKSLNDKDRIIEDLQERNADLQNRLSKVVGASIMNDNQNIPDLSDANRPTKLSEKFSELYDNEWTDAYEEVENEYNSEEKIIAHLHKTSEDIFDFCKKISEEHAKTIQACVLTVPYALKGRPKSAKIGITHQRQLKELRKCFAPYLVDHVFEHFVHTLKIDLVGKKKTENFMKKCVEIC